MLAVAVEGQERQSAIGPSLESMVYRNILDAIINLDLAPGVRLVENRLANQLNVSRVPVREALYQLEREHLVIVSPRRGASVAPLTARDADEVYTLRITLEALAARLAAENASGEQIRAMEETLDHASRVASVDRRLFYKLGAEFHARIVDATDNHKLVFILRLISHHVSRLRSLQAQSSDLEIVTISERTHREILIAIARRQARRAERLMEEHVRAARDRIVRLLASSGTDTVISDSSATFDAT